MVRPLLEDTPERLKRRQYRIKSREKNPDYFKNKYENGKGTIFNVRITCDECGHEYYRNQRKMHENSRKHTGEERKKKDTVKSLKEELNEMKRKYNEGIYIKET